MKQKFTSLFFLFLIIGVIVKAQTPTVQDCLGAKVICQSLYIEPNPYRYTGEGNYPNEIYKEDGDTSCLANEQDGVWYMFTAQANGLLKFTIIPNNVVDDYDWDLFDLTNAKCGDLRINPYLYRVSSNTYGDFLYNGPTGANTDSIKEGDPVRDCNGINPYNGPPWNADIQVYKGHTYVLYVSNWTQSVFGYSIDFSLSASLIIDNLGPTIDKVSKIPTPGSSNVTVRFSEDVECNSVNANAFEVSDGVNTYPVTAVYSAVCALGASYAREFNLTVDYKFQPGDYKVKLIKSVKDVCGNLSNNGTLNFTVNKIKIDWVSKIDITKCYGDRTGEIYIFASSQGEKLYYSIDGGSTWYDNRGHFTNLWSGPYQIAVKNEYGYIEYGTTITINEPPQIKITNTVVNDVSMCNGYRNGSITISAQGGISPLSYSIDGGNSFIQYSGLFGNLFAGNYQVVVKDANSCYRVGKVLKINQPLAVTATGSHTDITNCNGDSTGSISLNASGGIPPYFYSIDGGIRYQLDNGFFANLTSGSYLIKIKDKNNCFAKDTQIYIKQPPLLIIDKVLSQNVNGCYRSKNGSINISLKGGTPDYYYSVDSARTFTNNQGQFNQLDIGFYRIVVKDAKGCYLFGNRVIITEPPKLLVTNIQRADISKCYNDKDGKIIITASGGMSPLNYSIDGGINYQASNSFLGIKAGQYAIKVKDNYLCIVDGGQVIIKQPPRLVINSETHSNLTCYGSQNGMINLTASGGTGAIFFSVDGSGNFKNSGKFENLTAKNYIPIIKDENNCQYQGEIITISQPSRIIFKSIINTDIPTCYSNSDGSINVIAAGGTGKLYYSLNGKLPVAASGNFTGLTAGKYVVSVKDDNLCLASTDSILLTQPSTVRLQILQQQNIKCFGASNGVITLKATGGNGRYSYSKNGGLNYLNYNGLFSKLAPGSYDLIARDTMGCVSNNIKTTIIQQPQLKTDSIKFKNVEKCFGYNNAEIQIFASGGTWPLKYSIFGQKGNYSNYNKFEFLKAGNYPISIKDTNDCILNSDTIKINQPQQLIVKTSSYSNLKCYKSNDGKIELSALGGSKPYYYSIDGGLIFQEDFKFDNLLNGSYYIVSKDVNNCIAKGDTINIIEPGLLKFESLQKNDVKTCNGDSTGSITAIASGGTGAIQFSLNFQPFINNQGKFVKIPFGKYVVKAKDMNLCQVNSDSISILQPGLIKTDSIALIKPLCFGTSTGKINIYAKGGNGGFSYSIDGGLSFKNNSGAFLNLFSGSYPLVIKDITNCIYKGGNLFLGSPVKIQIDSVNKIDIKSCYGDSTGLILVFAQGGTGKLGYSLDTTTIFYSANLFSGLKEGKYLVHVKDENKCKVSSDTIKIIQPSMVIIDSVITKNISCFGYNNGQIQVFASGGNKQYNFLLDHDQRFVNKDGHFMGLSPSSYNLFVKDINNCKSKVDVINLIEPLPLNIDSVDIKHILTCFGDSTGKIKLFTSGGNGNMTFSLNDTIHFKENNGLFEKLNSGTYIIHIKDKNACELNSDTLILTQPEQVKILSQEKNDITCNGLRNGIIKINAVGGNGKYWFSIDGGKQNFKNIKIFNGLKAGEYQIVVQDTNWCIAKGNKIQIIEPEIIKIKNNTVKDISCFGKNDGEIDIEIQAPSDAKLNLQWSNGSRNEDISALSADFYSVTIIDTLSNECAVGYFEIKEPEKLKSIIDSVKASCFWEQDGKINLTISGGIPGYTSFWKNGKAELITNLEALAPGKYYVLITDLHGCTLSDSAVIGYEKCESKLLEVPNVITPGLKDGKNDELSVKTKYISKFKGIIFNRWGQVIYEWYSPVENDKDIYVWNSKVEDSNKTVSPGVYFYVIQAEGKDGKKHVKNGFVHVY